MEVWITHPEVTFILTDNKGRSQGVKTSRMTIVSTPPDANYPDEHPVYYAASFCADHDNFSKKLGTEMAKERLEQAMKDPKSKARCEYYTAYNKYHLFWENLFNHLIEERSPNRWKILSIRFVKKDTLLDRARAALPAE